MIECGTRSTTHSCGWGLIAGSYTFSCIRTTSKDVYLQNQEGDDGRHVQVRLRLNELFQIPIDAPKVGSASARKKERSGSGITRKSRDKKIVFTLKNGQNRREMAFQRTKKCG